MNFTITKPELFVDNQARKRSGHMGHALVEYKPGKILDFYSDCDYDRVSGHSGYGWMEYRRSEDYGRTWGNERVLNYTKRVFDEGVHTALCEKAMANSKGDICCLFQITDASRPIACEPWSEPTYIISRDGGESWSDARQACPVKGRIYDSLARGDTLHFLIHDNPHFIGNAPEHCFRLYRSDDLNAGFYEQSVLPINAIGKGYCTMEYMQDGSIIAYVYDSLNETHMPYCISRDGGDSWDECGSAYFAKKIRNPQLVRTHKLWFLCGRNGDKGDGLVIYSSPDGINWDEGVIAATRPVDGCAYYSNTLYIKESGRVLVQFSHVYDRNRVNIMHLWIDQ
ncbi:MAG: exo-alpha-sialidase [Clostridia bacterium]|nr:exo-alpha-sialidase [Clostridia bacterium]